MRHAAHGRRTSAGGRLTGRTVLIGLLSLSLVAAGSSSLATGSTDDLAGDVPPAVQAEEATTALEPATEVEALEGAVPEAPAVEEPAAEEPAGPAPDPAAVAIGEEPDRDEIADEANPEAGDGVQAEGPAEAGSAGEAAEPRGTDAEAADVAPMAVPSPGSTSSVITVKVGGDRTGGSSVAGLDGVTLRLYEGGQSGPTAPVDADWATCVSDSAGDCSFTVPETQESVRECVFWFVVCLDWRVISPAGENRDRQFWVVQESAPGGWYPNTSLVTGAANSQQSTAYRFRTGSQLRAGNTYRSGTHFMAGSGDQTRDVSSGRWQVSRDNPQLPATCEAGIDVALVLDLSGSVANAGAVGDLKSSAIAFAEALEGTGSRLALFTFASTAPRNTSPSGRNYPDLLPIDGNLSTIRQRINGYQAEGGTNWDRGIAQVAENGQRFDIAIVITDGLATFYGTGNNPAGPGSFTRFVETEQAVFSANALKAEGTRVLAVGVGDGISGHAHNLRAVSGPNGYTAGASANTADYFQTGWRQLAPLLENLAKGATCQATVTVDKVAEPYGGASGPGKGWTFTAARTAGAGQLLPAGPQVTGASGAVEYTVRFDRPDAPAATVRVAEQISSAQQSDGWSLSSVGCTVNGQPRDVTRDGDAVAVTGITAGDDVACTFTNVQTLEPGVAIVKRAWDVASWPAGAGLPDADRELAPGSAIPDGATVTWTYTVRNTGRTVLHDVTVTDDRVPTVQCPSSQLEIGEAMVCTASGAVTPAGP